MATGDPVVQIIKPMPLSASAATPDVRAGGSTPAEAVDVFDFDAAADEYLDFLCRLHGYGGGGLTFTLGWMASSASASDVRWGIAIRALPDDAEDIDASHTYDFNEATSTAASASGEVQYVNIAFTHGADMDSWADAELAIVRVYRNADDGADTMAGDAELLSISARET